MDRNPVDGYKDVYPWPYSWSRDFAPAVSAWLDDLDETIRFLEPWTYENHWRYRPVEDEDQHRYVLDLYQAGTAARRAQLPLDRGDEVAAYAADGWDEEIEVILWNHHVWEPGKGWLPYRGPQGDFVEHVHIEFNIAGLKVWYAGLDVVVQP